MFGITKSNQMWCKLTSSNVACHGLVRQTSLTSLQMENSLCCIVFHRQSQLSRSLSFSHARSPSLSVIMNKITLVTDWWNHDGLQGWFQWFILAEHWPSVSVATVFLFIFDLSHVWLSPLAILPSEIFLLGRRWMHTIGLSLFFVLGGSLGWEKVCTTVFPLPAPEVWGSGEKCCQLLWQNNETP